MSEDQPLPEDLIDLQRARGAARRALDVHAWEMTLARRAAAAAAGAGVQEQPWREEDLAREVELRGVYRTTVAAIAAHPVMVQAAAERRGWAVEEKLRALAPTPEIVVVLDEELGREVVEVRIAGVAVERNGAPLNPVA
ncbi:hypothetical protein GCM10009665_33330 [Kitasatospora nipponensis]|uniref:Gam-like protein n=1 Tax=Kitasatospora nipponensis TaxID=258049 RepID=A0ABN1WC62_9ACTN